MKSVLVLSVLTISIFGCTNIWNGPWDSGQMEEHQKVEEALTALIQAYEGHNLFKFKELISDDFTGDKVSLEMAVQRDFSAFQDIDIDYTINNITSDWRGRVFVAIQFSRAHTDMATGKRETSRGTASFIFRRENDSYRLLTQKQPLFGIQ